MNVTKLTCIVQSGGDGGSGLLVTVLGHSAVGFHGESVVEMRVKVTDYDHGVLQVCGSWFKADLLATGDAQGSVAMLTHHTVGEVRAAPRHQRRAPGQLQPALC